MHNIRLFCIILLTRPRTGTKLLQELFLFTTSAMFNVVKKVPRFRGLQQYSRTII